MTLKSVLMGSALCLSVLAVSPLAHAAGFEKKLDARTVIGESKTPDVSASQAQDNRAEAKPAAAFDKSVSTPVQRQPTNATQRMVSTDSKQIDFVAQSTKAHAAKTGHGKPAEEAKGTSKGSSGSGGSQNPIAARMDVNARAMGVVATAKKAKAEKNASGKPSEQITSGGSSMGGSSSKGGSQNPIAARMDTGARAMEVVAQSMKAKAQKNASGKPSETPKGNGGISVRGTGHSGGHGGGRFAQLPSERVGARSPSGRGSPGERSSSHCNARGMCF